MDVATQAARQAGEYICSKWGTGVAFELKGDINLVTEVDKHAEKIIVEHILSVFPDHDIMGEEGQAARKNSEYKWIIDPLDGTTNFAHSYPLFAVSIALEHKGEIVVGVVYDPLRRELFSASRGNGAFLNGNPIRVSAVKTLGSALVGTGFAYNVRETKDNNLREFANMIMHAQGVRRDGVAAIDLCYVACGRYDAFWELNLFPWDVAAGVLVIREAGGRVSNYKGKDFSVYEKEILATNGGFHDEMLAVVTKTD